MISESKDEKCEKKRQFGAISLYQNVIKVRLFAITVWVHIAWVQISPNIKPQQEFT